MFLSVTFCIILGCVIVFWFRKKKIFSDKKLLQQGKKHKQLSNNYSQLLKNYQYTNKQLGVIKKSLLGEIKGQKNNQLYKKIHHYDFLKTNEDLLPLNTLRDQFMINVKEQFPTVSTAQLLILFYTKIGLTSKEISNMLKLSVRSVESYNYRFGKQVKKQLNQPLKEYLENYSFLE